MLTLLLFAASPVEWWNEAWEARRPIRLTTVNVEVPRGAVVTVPLRSRLLGIRDPESWRLVRGGQEVPSLVRPSTNPDFDWDVVFAAVETIAAGAHDRYDLYYGNDQAPPRTWTGRDIYPVYVDFRTDEVDVGGWDVERTDEGLVIRGFGDGPGEISIPRSGSVSGSFEARLNILPPPMAGSIEVGIRLQAAGGEPDEETRERIAGLIDLLGGAAWREREEATEALIALGRVALPQLREAAQSSDPEVSARAQFAIGAIEESLQIADQSLVFSVTDGAGRVIHRSGESDVSSIIYGPGGGFDLRVVATTYAARPAMVMYVDRFAVGQPLVPPQGALGVGVVLRHTGGELAAPITLVELAAAPMSPALSEPAPVIELAESRPLTTNP